jgi:signal transduction histidine kinase
MLLRLNKYLKTTRFRITIWYSIIFLLLEIVLGILIYTYLQQTMIKELDISLSKQAEMIYHFVVESEVDLSDFKPDSIYSSQDELVYDLIFEAVAFNPNNTFVQVRLKDKIIFKSSNLINKEIEFPKETIEELALYSFSDPSISSNKIRAAYYKKDGYYILVAFPVGLINKTLENLTDLYALISPIFLLLSFIGGALLSLKSLSRIDKVIKKTDEITTQNLNEIVEGQDLDDEYGRLVKTMNKMIERIRTSIDYMNQFSIAASHELKTPLTILRGEIELALKSVRTPEQYREVLQSNYEETLRLINIIDKLFYISSIDHSLIKINKSSFDIKVLIRDLIKSFSSFLANKKMGLLNNCEEDGALYVLADQVLLRQVFTNLIENAIKFGDENSKITIRCDKIENDKIKIFVSNYGEIIPQESLNKVFERFYRTESSRNRNLGGIGLGLSVVKSIINLHEGEIFADCSPEGKITFTVLI